MEELDFKKLSKEFKQLQEAIIKFDNIVIYRHSSPDFDALGSQMGLYTWIKTYFPNKEVHFVGDNLNTLMPLIYPVSEKVDPSFFLKEHLAITVDVADFPRVSENDLKYAKMVIKIDHHHLPIKEKQFGDLVICYPTIAACSEIIALFILSRKKKLGMTKEIAYYLYSGIVGDTGRFLYQDTKPHTLSVASALLATDFDKEDLYSKMYLTDQRRLNILKFVLNNYKLTSRGVCYYILKKEDMESLNMNIDEGNLHINTFRNLEGVKAVISVSYDVNKNNYRVSIRSVSKPINDVANRFNGGGHDFAAGCRLDDLSQLELLVKDVEDKVN